MQAPHRPQTVDVNNDNIIYCPECNLNLFSALSVYAVTPSQVIDAPPILSQSLCAIKCGGCGVILPLSQVPEFTHAALRKAAEAKAEKERLNGQANAEAQAVAENPAENITSSDSEPTAAATDIEPPFAGDTY